jgi:tetratricopeptide (TPR) repeat protein
VVQVGVVYLGASWVVLQLVSTLMDLLALPQWLGPVTVVLLGVGFLVVTATAWVQSLDSTTQAEEAGEVPTDWEVDAADALASLRAGRLPHLTWGRALVSGVIALSLAIGVAGAWVLVRGGDGLISPTPVSAGDAGTGIAVLPFDADGADVEFMREGMVRLVSASLDGVGDFRAIDSRTVLARWDEQLAGGGRPDLDAMLRVAGRTGARYAVVGSVVPAGGEVRVDVDVYDLDDGANVADVRVEGTADGILDLVDRLTVALARELLGATGADDVGARTLASITTSSPEALRFYLEGERIHRKGNVEDAMELFAQATAIDSTFALAWMRLNDAAGWAVGQQYIGAEAMERARVFRDRLSPRREELLEARSHGWGEGIGLMSEYVRRYPDDAEAWHRLGNDVLHHIWQEGGVPEFSRARAEEALRRAAELDPGFAPYRIHLVDFAFLRGDDVAARAEMEAYFANGGGANDYSVMWNAGYRILFGPEEGVEAAVREAEGTPDYDMAVALAMGTMGGSMGSDLRSRDLKLRRAKEVTDAGEPRHTLAPWLRNAGLMREWEQVLRQGRRLPAELPVALSEALYARAVLGRDLGIFSAEPESRACEGADDCFEEVLGRLVHGALTGHKDEYRVALAQVDERVDAWEATLPPDFRYYARGWSTSVVGLAQYVAGDVEDAVRLWDTTAGWADGKHLVRGMLAEERRDVEGAIRYYDAALWTADRPLASYRLAALLESEGRSDEAEPHWRRLGLIWAEADEDFGPAAEMRAALERLGR